MSYQPPDGQFPNGPYTPNTPYGGAPEYGQPAYTPEGPTNPGPYAPPPAPPAYPPAPIPGYAPLPTGPTASYGGYAGPYAPSPPPPGPTAPYGGYAPPPPYQAQPSQGLYGQPPYQGQPSQALYGQQPVVYQPVVYQPVVMQSQDAGAAVAVEVIAGLFGFWGIGWLMKGYTSTGIIMLISGLITIPVVAIILAVATFGFGLPCLGVANIIFVIVSAVNLNNRVKSGVPRL